MRDWSHHDRYLNELYGDIYRQPEDAGHTRMAMRVIDKWMGLMPTCQTVLDLGCGTGFCQPMFERWGKTYEGICLGDDYQYAKSLGRNVRLMDFSFLEYEESSFDLLFSRHSLEHSPMPILTLMEWARVSKTWLGIIVPALEWYGVKGQNHYSVMTLEQWEVVIDRAGWKILWNEIQELPFVPSDKSSKKPNEYWIMCEKKKRF